MDDDVLCAMRALEERVTELESRVSNHESTGVLGICGGVDPADPDCLDYEDLEAVFSDEDPDDCHDPDHVGSD